MRVFADLWDNDYSSPTHLEHIGQVAELGGDWDLPGGLQRIGAAVRRPGRTAWDAYSEWAGLRLILHLDGYLSRPLIDATIVKPALLRGRVGIMAAGPWWGCLYNDYETTQPASGENTDDTIKAALTNHAPNISSDQSHICATTMPTLGLRMGDEGLHPGRMIEELVRAGDGTGNNLLFWLEPAPFTGAGKPQKPIAYLEAMSATAGVNWQIEARDRVRGSRQLELDISDLATSVTASYRNPDYSHDSEQGTVSYQDTARNLQDTGQDFSAWQTANGEAIYRVVVTNDDNTERRAYLGAVVGGTSNQQIYCYKDRLMAERGFTGATAASATPSKYRVYKVNPIYQTAAATNNTADYWTRKRVVSARGLQSAAAAAEVRDVELARLSNPQMRYSMTLGSREIMDGEGRRWPLALMLLSGGYLRDNSVGIDEGIVGASLDWLRVGRITSMRYDHAARQMALSFGESRALDSVLAKFGYNWQTAQQLERELVPVWG